VETDVRLDGLGMEDRFAEGGRIVEAVESRRKIPTEFILEG